MQVWIIYAFYVLFSIIIMSSNLSRKNTNVYLPIDKCSSTESDIPATHLFVSIILVSYISYILNYEQNVRNSNNYLALSPSFPHENLMQNFYYLKSIKGKGIYDKISKYSDTFWEFLLTFWSYILHQNMRNKADQTNYLSMYIHKSCKLFYQHCS